MDCLANQRFLPNYEKVDLSTCKCCLTSKSIGKPFGKEARANFPLQLVHYDICGPMNVKVKHKAYYFITFIDNFTLFNIIYLITYKSEALSCFQSYTSLVKN